MPSTHLKAFLEAAQLAGITHLRLKGMNMTDSLDFARVDPVQMERLDEIAREAWSGNYRRVGVLSSGERQYVALASGRMREICPDDSIPYAVDSLDPGWFKHMLSVWKSDSQPSDET